MSAPPPPPPPPPSVPPPGAVPGVVPPPGIVPPGMVPPPAAVVPPPGAPPPVVGMVPPPGLPPPPPMATGVLPPPPPVAIPPPVIPPPVLGSVPPPMSVPPPNMTVPPPNFIVNRTPFVKTSRPSSMVLLTNVPVHMTTKRLKEWIYPCGSAVNVVMVPSEEKKENDNVVEKEDSAVIEVPQLALVTMSHADGALKLVCSYNHIRKDLEEINMRAHLLPTDPDVAMPPPLMDEEATRVLGDKLKSGLAIDYSKEEENENADADTPISTEQKLDVEKVAAAAGGGAYDPEEDPLNAPAVLEAVALFRKQLSSVQSSQKKKRIEMVSAKLEKALVEARERLERERQGPPPAPAAITAPPPSDDTAALFKESGRRGVSNLPAWMTKDRPEAAEQAQAVAEDAPIVEKGQPEGPPRKKPKLDLTQIPKDPLQEGVVFGQVGEADRGVVKAYIASQIAEYLGEEEVTLIDFCLKHVMEQKSTTALLEELKLVLEEDAPVFVKNLYQKVMDLQ